MKSCRTATYVAKQKNGFTLVELLVSIAIVAILASMGIPAYQDYTKKAYVAEGLQLANHAKNIVLTNAAQGGSYSSGFTSNPTKSVSSIWINPTNGMIFITYSARLDGKTLLLIPRYIPDGSTTYAVLPNLSLSTTNGPMMSQSGIVWTCRSADSTNTNLKGTLPGKYAPPDCSGFVPL